MLAITLFLQDYRMLCIQVYFCRLLGCSCQPICNYCSMLVRAEDTILIQTLSTIESSCVRDNRWSSTVSILSASSCSTSTILQSSGMALPCRTQVCIQRTSLKGCEFQILHAHRWSKVSLYDMWSRQSKN